jgi:protein-tyrosine phosphatase
VEQVWLRGAPNARDLGGIPVAAGRAVRAGVLFRAPALGRLTDEDVAALRRVGLAEVIDLRHPREIELTPPDRLPDGLAVAHVPIFERDHPVFIFVAGIMLTPPAGAPPESAAPRPGEVGAGDMAAYENGAIGAMCDVYRWFVTSAAAREAFGTAVRRVAAAAGRPLLYHCSAGKDRTGWLTAILLTALGAERDVVLADYLRTNVDGERSVEKILRALAARRAVDPERVRPVLVAAPEYLAAGYAEAERAYGSFDGYLRDGLGLDERLRAGLRATLLEP